MVIVPAKGLLDGQVQVFQRLVFSQLDIPPHLGQGAMIHAEDVAGEVAFLRFL